MREASEKRTTASVASASVSHGRARRSHGDAVEEQRPQQDTRATTTIGGVIGVFDRRWETPATSSSASPSVASPQFTPPTVQGPPTAYPVGMGDTAIVEGSLAARARDWRNAMHAAVCDVIEPWAHGTVARAGRYPTYYDFNVLRVEDDVALDVPQLEAAADEALKGLEHRRVDFDILERGAQRRSDFEAAGWKTTRLVWMLHAGVVPGEAPEVLVEEVDYEETEPLRLRWHLEETPSSSTSSTALRKGGRDGQRPQRADRP